MRRIVVLDGHTLNPGDNPWDPVAQHGTLQVYDRTDPNDEQLICSRADGARIVLTNKTPLTASTLGRLSELRFIGVLATGYDVVDMEASRQRDITVCNVPEYGTDAVAEHVFALLFGLWRRVSLHDDAVRDGEWARREDFTFQLRPQRGLNGKTLGIIGFGRIGQAVADRALAFGMTVIAHSRSAIEHPKVESVALDTLLSRSDVVSLHCPATPETEGLLSRERLEQMKSGAVLINTARGTLVDQAALADLLRDGHLGGAGLDVVSSEPIASDNPILAAPNTLITPHLAWATLEARRRLMRIMGNNIAAYLQGEPQNVVS